MRFIDLPQLRHVGELNPIFSQDFNSIVALALTYSAQSMPKQAALILWITAVVVSGVAGHRAIGFRYINCASATSTNIEFTP